jgi:hypothetical protein
MLRGCGLKFLNDERGGGTVMGLLWFILLVGICGLSVDITDGFRSQTMLQATADAAALAAVIDLPDQAEAVATALAYSNSNMAEDEYGTVLIGADVDIGDWDEATHIFTAGAAAPDAVRVRTRRSIENENAVPVNFLRIIGLFEWNVTTHAIAQRFIPDCLTDGLVARGIVDMSSRNTFSNDMCVHGQEGVHMSMDNEFGPGVRVTMPDLANDLVTPGGGMDGNPGLADAAGEESLDPRMVNHIDEIIDDLLALKSTVTPDYIDANIKVNVRDENYNFNDLVAGQVYHIECAANKNVGIPNNTVISEVVIVADCQIGVGSGVEMSDVVLASRAGGNPGGSPDGNTGGKGGKKQSGHGGAGIENANINVSANAVLGTADDCQPGGGVQIFSNASVHFSSSTSYNGVQIVVSGDVDLGARDDGINGINVQAGGDITLASNDAFGICTGGAPALFTVNYYRLVF